MRIAWISPLPPAPSGIADYSAELLPLIARQAAVDVFAPRPGRRQGLLVPEGTRAFRPVELDRRAPQYDAIFHHLGNNPHHEYVYRLALAHPGVVVFHDFVLHHLIAHMFAERTPDWRRYRTLLEDEYGEVGRRLTHLRAKGVATDMEKFMFPMTAHLARPARAVVVHSRAVAERVREIAPGVPVTVIPHHAGTPPAEIEGVTREEARARLGLPGDSFLVGQFGFLTYPKQPAAVLSGFRAFAEDRPDALLLMIGENQTPPRGLPLLIRSLGLGDQVRSVGFVDLTRFYLYLMAVDAVVNLRYPSAGEASGTFARALAAGRATIVSNVGSFAEVPGDATLKVELDEDQAAAVSAHLARLAGDPGFREAVENRARTFASAFLDQRRCADLYLQVAREAAGRTLDRTSVRTS